MTRLATCLFLFVTTSFSYAAEPVKARSTIRVLQVSGQIQIKYSDDEGDHVIYLDSRHYQLEDLPADAQFVVLGGDAQFECGGALINAISGTIFSAGEAKGWEHLFVRQGELVVDVDGKTTVLDRDRYSMTYHKTGKPAEFKGFLR